MKKTINYRCQICKIEHKRDYTLYCSKECEEVAVKLWQRNPGTKYNNVEFPLVEERKQELWQASANRLNR